MTDIIKERIHPEGSPDTVIYPETDYEQVKNKALYKHTIEVLSLPNSDNHYLVITYDLYSYDRTPLTINNVRDDVFYNGICIVYDDDSSAEKILGICGKFRYYRSSSLGLLVDIFRNQDEREFRVNSLTDTVTNIFTELITG